MFSPGVNSLGFSPTNQHDNMSGDYSSIQDIYSLTNNRSNGNITVHPYGGEFRPFVSSEWIVYIHSSILVIVNFISLMSNIIVIYLYATNRMLRTRSNIIVMSLTTSDLIFASVMFVFGISTDAVRRNKESVTCVLVNFALIQLSMTVSSWSLVALATDRYLSIYMPFRSHSLIKYR